MDKRELANTLRQLNTLERDILEAVIIHGDKSLPSQERSYLSKFVDLGLLFESRVIGRGYSTFAYAAGPITDFFILRSTPEFI